METQVINQSTEVISNSTIDTGVNFTGGLLQAHETISGWEILERINTLSGEADIYLAQKNDNKGVIKYYRGKISPKTEILEKLKGLNHPDIVNLYEFGQYKERFYEIMEYAAGGSFDSRNEDGSYKHLPLSEEQAIQVCREVINSFKMCHEKGIIHRDIKPANLYYRNADGSDLVIGDFGISSVMDELDKLHKTQTASRTTGYAAPEVLSGVISQKMDYYALGITLWELLTGEDPFQHNGKRRNDAHLIRDTIEGRIADDILSKEPFLSQPMQRLIRGLLVVDHEHRWGYDEVEQHLDGKEVPVHQKGKSTIDITIGEVTCSSIEQIGTALLEYPEASQRYVFRGIVAGYLEDDYPDIAKKIEEITEETSAENDYYNGILKIAYLLNPALPLKLDNGFFANNIDDIIFLLENAPETMLPLLKDESSKLFVYLETINYEDQADEIKDMLGDITDIELVGKATVILKDYIIKPFKLARYADFELSDLEQICNVPKDMQNHILNLVSQKSYEGNFLPWLMLISHVDIDRIKIHSWKEFLDSIGAIKSKKNSAGYYYDRGISHADKNNHDKVINDFSEVIKLEPNNALAYNKRGNGYYYKKQYDEALKDYNEAIRLDPNFPNPYYNRGNIYYARGQGDEAIKEYNEAIRLDPNFALAYNNRGNTYHRKGQYDEAIKDYSEAIRLDPDYADAYWRRGNS